MKKVCSILSLIVPILFIGSVFVGLLLGFLLLIYIATILCLIGIALGLNAIKKHNDSNNFLARLGIILNFVCVLLVLLCFSFTHKFGPHKGTVVDNETGKPILGAVVVIRVFTRIPNAAGGYSRFAHALEVIADKNGEFIIPSYRLWKLDALSVWSEEYFTVFKPEYEDNPIFSYEKDKIYKQVMTIKLSKIKDLSNLKSSGPSLGGDVDNMLYVFSQYKDQRDMLRGFKHSHIGSYWRYNGYIKGDEETILDYPLNRRSHVVDVIPRSGGGVGKGILSQRQQKTSSDSFRRAVMVQSSPVDNPYVGSIKYNFQEEQEELIKELKKKGIKFIVTEDSTVKYPTESKDEVYKIIKKFDSKPRIFFINKENCDFFTNSLEQNNTPFLLRTVPNIKGYDVIWDYKYNDKVEVLKLELFKEVIKNESYRDIDYHGISVPET